MQLKQSNYTVIEPANLCYTVTPFTSVEDMTEMKRNANAEKKSKKYVEKLSILVSFGFFSSITYICYYLYNS